MEINRNRQGQAVYKIFSIKYRFHLCKSQLLMFKEACARKHQRGVTL